MTDNNRPGRTRPIKGDPDGHNDLLVVWDSTGTRILSDRRSKKISEK